MSVSKKLAVIVDSWKLPIFERHFRKAGYAWETGPAVTPDTLRLIVITESISAFGEVVKAAQREAETTGAPDVRR